MTELPTSAPRLATAESALAAAAVPRPRAAELEINDALVRRHEPRNLVVLAVHVVLLRIGWVFKTESVLIPAFVDAIAGPAWLRGCVPALSRFGQSVPPLFYSQRLKFSRRKKWALGSSMLGMGLVMLWLAAMCFATEGRYPGWVPAAFLALYALFASLNGITQLAYGTVQGKLIHATRRGLLLTISTFVGVLPAIALAWWVMPAWLRRTDGGYGLLFATSGLFFVLSGVAGWLVAEPADAAPSRPSGVGEYFVAAAATLRNDANFRRLCLVAMLFGTVQILFPHYQAYAKLRLDLSGAHLMQWVVVQNAALGGFSLLVGPIADFRGNRLALRGLILATALTPLLAVVLGQLDGDWGRRLFWLVFALLGLTPVTLKSLVNYTLEISRPIDHPQYLSTMTLCQAVPFLFSPLVGWALDATSFELVFLAGAAVIGTAGLLTFTLVEPRIAEQ